MAPFHEKKPNKTKGNGKKSGGKRKTKRTRESRLKLEIVCGILILNDVEHKLYNVASRR